MNNQEKLTALRAEMKRRDLDGFIVPRADEYQGEFVAPCAERLQWLTGFTGSAGTALILHDKAAVLTDGRYTLQVREQTDPALYETGDSTKTPAGDWLAQNVAPKAVIGYDPWLHTPDQIKTLEEEKDLAMQPVETNPLDAVWRDRPARPDAPAFLFPDEIAGATAKEKLGLVVEKIKEQGAQSCVLSLPDSIAWLLNVRGADIPCIPQILSYLAVHTDGRPAGWIVPPAKIPPDVAAHLDGLVQCTDLEGAMKDLRSGPVMLDFRHAPAWFNMRLEEQGAEIVNAHDPCIALKALKSETEQTAIKKAHELDTVALVNFLHWLEANAAETDEWTAGQRLKEFRAKNTAFRGESFPCIAGFASNGAIVHYRAAPKGSRPLKGNGLLLIDSGGQYLNPEKGVAGTTDITRTVAIGTPTQEMKERFTLVLKGHIAVAKARFPTGTTGAQIDALARQFLWSEGLDYAHGTGHGVGCYLAVHEEAANLSPRGKKPLEAGMLISNEPGYYKEGEYGIRIENLVLTRKAGQCAETGQEMLRFETVSFAPIDLTLIAADMLDKAERDWLNAYHRQVFEMTAPHLAPEVRDWLACRTGAL